MAGEVVLQCDLRGRLTVRLDRSSYSVTGEVVLQHDGLQEEKIYKNPSVHIITFKDSSDCLNSQYSNS